MTIIQLSALKVSSTEHLYTAKLSENTQVWLVVPSRGRIVTTLPQFERKSSVPAVKSDRGDVSCRARKDEKQMQKTKTKSGGEKVRDEEVERGGLVKRSSKRVDN